MTPINPATTGGLPAYDPYAGSGDALAYDPYEGMAPESIPPHVADGGAYDPAFADPGAVTGGGGMAADVGAYPSYDPSLGSGYEPAYDPYAGAYEQYDPYAGGYEQHETYQPTGPASTDASAIAPAQPGLGGVQATVEDFAALGIFAPEELQSLAASQMSSSELGALYTEILAYLETPEGQAELQARLADAGAAAAAGAGVDGSQQLPGAATGEPAWNDEWAERFRDVFKDQDLDSQTQMLLLGQLRQMGLPEDQLQQALEYYANTPEGKAELQQVDQQVRAAAGSQTKLLLAMGGLTLGLGAIPVGIARSQGNLVRMLERTGKSLAATNPEAARKVATALAMQDTPAARTALRNLRHAGISPADISKLDDAGRALARTDAAAVLRETGKGTRRILHPIGKMQFNGAARHLTPSTRISAREALKYGLGMRFGDNVDDVARAAQAVKGGGAAAAASTKAASAAGGAAAKAASSAGGAASKAASSAGAAAAKAAASGGGAAAAARGASMASRAGSFTKALGPIGLIAGTALGAWGVSKTMEAEGGFGKESAKMTGNVAGGLAGGVAGAAAGAAIGSVVPVIGTGIGAVVGGVIGGLGGSFGGEKLAGGLFDLFD